MTFFTETDFHSYYMGNTKSCSAAQAAEGANEILKDRSWIHVDESTGTRLRVIEPNQSEMNASRKKPSGSESKITESDLIAVLANRLHNGVLEDQDSAREVATFLVNEKMITKEILWGV